MAATSWDPKVRRAAYVVLAAWAVLNVGGQAGFIATGIDTPLWWKFQAAAFGALAAYTGLMARAWVPKTQAGQWAMQDADIRNTEGLGNDREVWKGEGNDVGMVPPPFEEDDWADPDATRVTATTIYGQPEHWPKDTDSATTTTTVNEGPAPH